MIELPGGVFQCRSDVFGFEIGIVGEDFITRDPCRKQIEDVLYTNA